MAGQFIGTDVMSNNSDKKQPAYSNRRSNKNAEGRPQAGGIGNLPGLTVADTFGLVACLAILSNRISHIKKCAFNKKRIVVFSGGNSKNTEDLLNEIKQINVGGGNGSINGRNTFQRPKKQAIDLLKKIIDIYKN